MKNIICTQKIFTLYIFEKQSKTGQNFFIKVLYFLEHSGNAYEFKMKFLMHFSSFFVLHIIYLKRLFILIYFIARTTNVSNKHNTLFS